MSATVTSANWIDAASVPSGTWTDPTHWSNGVVPTPSTDAFIGPSVSATAPWTVSLAGTQVVAGLTLEMGTLGTLSLAGNLGVSGVASIGSGTVNGGTVIVGQNDLFGVGGNSVAVGTTFEVNGGTVSTGGYSDLDGTTLNLNNGAVWNAATLWLGQFYYGTNASVQGAGAAIHASSVLNIGGDGGVASPLATGTGTLRAVGGAMVTAPTLTIVDGSALVVDSVSAVDLGNATSVAGAIAVGTSGLLALEAASVSANIVDNGRLQAVVNLGAASLAVGTGPIISGILTGSGSVLVGSGYTMEVGNAAGFIGGMTIDPNATLRVDAGAAPGGLMSMAGGTLDMRALIFGSGPALSYAGSTLTFGGDSIDVGAGSAAANFSVRADGAGGTLLVEAPCYAAGTRIATEWGEVAVETLQPGDRVRTASGRLAPVVWVGQTAIDLARHPAPRSIAPVRIAADAFAPGLPRRDLLVSPDHALLADGVLIPARRLVNGATIRQDQAMPSVRYVHVELDRHDLLLAEGLAAESYLDTGNRGQFDGNQGVRALHPRFDADPTGHALRIFAERGCAELVLDGPAAQAAHARLAARAEALGWQRSDDPRLRIEADRGGLIVTSPCADELRAILPPGTRRVRLSSRCFVPETITPGCGDDRVLGAAVAVEIDGAWLEGAALASGWYPAEHGMPWRWTDGMAMLDLPAESASVVLTVHVVRVAATYWVAPRTRAMVRAA